MDQTNFKNLVESTEHGKALPNAKYFHRSLVEQLEPALRDFVYLIERALKCKNWNVLKLSRREYRLSFLDYAEFEETPYPELKKSISVDLIKLSTENREYSTRVQITVLYCTVESKTVILYTSCELPSRRLEARRRSDQGVSPACAPSDAPPPPPILSRCRRAVARPRHNFNFNFTCKNL